MPRPILVSACLLGLPTRYDGGSKSHPGVLALVEDPALILIPVCPEQLAGLPTPRPPCSFLQGDGGDILAGRGELRDEGGRAMHEAFVRGAEVTARIAALTGCSEAILKERSPSCGVHQVVRSGLAVPGQGVTAAHLQRLGLKLRSEETL